MADASIKGTFHFTDLSASSALLKYAGLQGLKGRSMESTLRHIMKFWVSFAMKKIPQGKVSKIMADLGRVITSYSRISSGMVGMKTNLRTRKTTRDRTIDRWRGTYAAALVAMLDYKGARTMGAAQFYRTVAQFVSRRRFAANLHRSGLRPAIMRLRAKTTGAGRLPEFKNQPGLHKEQVSARVAEILVENWAASRDGDGITKLAPGAFDDAFAEVEKILTKWFEKDIKKWAKEVGLRADN